MPGLMQPQPEPDYRVPLVANLESRDGTLTKDALMTNCYAEMRPIPRAFMRPALVSSVAGTSNGQGMVATTGTLFSFANSIVNSVTKGGITLSTGAPPAFGGTILYFNGYLYYIGGGSSAAPNNSVWRTSPGSFTWTLLTSSAFSAGGITAGSATPGEIFSCVALGRMYVFGGVVAGGGGNSDGYYSTDGITWTRMVNAISGLSGNNVVFFSGNFYTILGATNGVSSGSKSATAANGTWSTLANAVVTNRIQNGTAFAHGGFLYMVGFSGVGQGHVAYTSDGVTWTSVAASAVVSGTGFAKGTSYNGRMYITDNSGAVQNSADGVTWTTATTNAGGATPTIVETVAMAASFAINYTNTTSTATSKVGYSSSSGALVSFVGATLGQINVKERVDAAINTGSTKLMVKGLNAAYWVNPSTAAATLISDSNYPAVTVRGIVYLEGTYYVMDPSGTIWNSVGLDDPTTWAANNNIAGDYDADPGVCLARYINYVCAMKQWTVQMFWNAGISPGSPLVPVNNGVMAIGCATADSVAQAESTILWIAQRKGQGSTSQLGRFVAMLQGTSYIEVSTPDVNRVLDADDLVTVYSAIMEIAGHTFYVLSLGTSNVSLVYDFKEKLWYIWSRLTAGSAVTLTSLTQSIGLATATKAGHGFSDGDPVTIAGANQAGYNLTNVNINVTSTSVFTYPVAAGTVSPATGTITATGYTEAYMDIVASCGFANKQVVQDTTGAILSLSLTAAQDPSTTPINMKIRTSPQDNGNSERKFAFAAALISDTAPSAATGLLRHSDDDYQTNTYYRALDMTQVRNHINRCGNYRKRSWEMRYTSGVRLRFQAIEPSIQQGVQ